MDYARRLGGGRLIPIALNFDHGTNVDDCKACIDNGFSSVMIDGSRFPFEENVEMTKEVVDFAHERDVAVEGELGVLAGKEEDVESGEHIYTQPEQVDEFVRRTGVDCLAIAIGTSPWRS